MRAIEQTARKLLVEKYRERGQERYAQMLEQGDAIAVEADKSAIAAIIAALTPPEGYVLVPVELTDSMHEVLLNMLTHCDTVEESYADLLAARPEVKP